MSSEVKTLSNKRIYSASFKAADIFKMDNLTSPFQKHFLFLSLSLSPSSALQLCLLLFHLLLHTEQWKIVAPEKLHCK